MNNIAIIDVEASGLHFDSYPIEIAVLKGGEVKSWLIKPEPQWIYWSSTAEGMHGISREQLEREGLPAITVAQELNAYMSDYDGVVYSDAERWDSDWIDTLYFTVKISREFHIGSIFDLLGAVAEVRFESCIKELVASGRFSHHRAYSDVRMIAEAFAMVRRG